MNWAACCVRKYINESEAIEWQERYAPDAGNILFLRPQAEESVPNADIPWYCLQTTEKAAEDRSVQTADSLQCLTENAGIVAQFINK